MPHESPQVLKQTLPNIIPDMQTSLDLFVKQPGKDFIRNRKLTFSGIINFFLSMGGNTVRKELLNFFDYSSDCISASAFSQQIAKILPEALVATALYLFDGILMYKASIFYPYISTGYVFRFKHLFYNCNIKGIRCAPGISDEIYGIRKSR